MAIAVWSLAAVRIVALVGDAFVFSNRMALRMADRSEIHDVLQQVLGAVASCLLRYFYDPELSSYSGKRPRESQAIANSKRGRLDLLPGRNNGHCSGRLARQFRLCALGG